MTVSMSAYQDAINLRLNVAKSERPVEIAFGVLPNCPRLDVVLACEVLRFANGVAGEQRFVWKLVSTSMTPVVLTDGGTIKPDRLLGDIKKTDVAIVIGGHPPPTDTAQLFTRWLRRLDREGTLIGGVDWGVVLLAEAGLLQGAQISAHWETAARLNEANEGYLLNDRLYTYDRNRLTGAGRASLLEMMLFVIKLFCGQELAVATGQDLIYSTPRPPESPQRLPYGVSFIAADRRLKACLIRMEASLDSPLTVSDLSRAIGVSSRYLQKLCKNELGISLMGYYLILRLSKARDLLLHTSMPILDVATATGFSSAAVFARAFKRHFGKAASTYRHDYLHSRLRPFDFLAGGPAARRNTV